MLPANRVPDPTPAEIAERAARIREEWSEETMRNRCWERSMPVEDVLYRLGDGMQLQPDLELF